MNIESNEVSTSERFRIWYKDIFQFLEDKSPNGNGAIIALMGALPLYERWVVSSCSPNNYANRIALIISDLKINDKNKAERFWNVVRDGLCHTGSFFEESDKITKEKKWEYLPKIGLDGSYPDFPTFVIDPQSGRDVILFNPWKLVRHIVSKYENNTSILEGSVAPLLPLYYKVCNKKSEESI